MLEPGQIFAHRYRVNRRIAEGGMGAIFEAEHMATERRVALKLLFPHIMSVASARQKFELEAKISARVNSRNIVEVIDAGFDEATQSPFLVMELLDGHTLAQFVREHGPLGVDEGLLLLEQVASGLDAAHGYREASGASKPIVHRDLKPENLFMAREHGATIMKILDFGIAKVLGETGNVSQEVRGTPLYMAFEQVTAGPLSPRTDVWALGLIAYYMFTGSHYWRASSQPSANVQSLFAEILSLPLEPPSVRMRQQNVPVELPAAFDGWLLDCLQRDSGRRHSSAGVAIAALARALGTSVRPRPRIDSRPAPAPVFAATEAYEPPPVGRGAIEAAARQSARPAARRSLEQAAPRESARPVDARQSMRPPDARGSVTTAASLSGVASERGPSLAPARSLRQRPWLGAAAGGAVLLVGAVTWLASGSGNSPSAASAPPGSAASPELPGDRSSEPSAVATARPHPEAPVSSAHSTPSPQPLLSADEARPAALKGPIEPPVSLPAEPLIRVAPRDEGEAALDIPRPASAEQGSPTTAAPPLGHALATTLQTPAAHSASADVGGSPKAGSAGASASDERSSAHPSAAIPPSGSAAPTIPAPAQPTASTPAPERARASARVPPTPENPRPEAAPARSPSKAPTPADQAKKPSKNAEAYRMR